MDSTNSRSEKLISNIILSHERQINRIISFFENERNAIRSQEAQKFEREKNLWDKGIKFLKGSGILPAMASYLLQGSSLESNKDEKPLANDVPLIVCCKWLNHYLESNELLQSFIKKTLRKDVYDKFLILLNSGSSKDFDNNLKEFKEELTHEDLQDLNSIDPRLSEMEKMLLIKIING